MNLTDVISSIQQKGYRVFTRPFELNIVGIRSAQVHANSFDDVICVFYKTDAVNWVFQVFAATTDPGNFWLQNPITSKGTAILKPGQYINAYALGMHRGKYLALVQSREVTVYRDANRDMVLNAGAKTETGFFGINIHRALQSGTTKYVDKFSAGCQVFASAGDFATFMQLCEVHKKLYGNQFTYTLLNGTEQLNTQTQTPAQGNNQNNNSSNKNVKTIMAVLSGLGLGYFTYLIINTHAKFYKAVTEGQRWLFQLTGTCNRHPVINPCGELGGTAVLWH